MSKLDLEDRGRSLEEEFFRKEQARQLEAIRARKEHDAGVEALRAATGLHDDEVLGLLVDRGVSTATLAAFALVPLAQVAWASGSLEPAERRAVLQAAHDLGIHEGTAAHEFLAHLLEARPPGALMDAWEAFVVALRKEAGPDAFERIGGDVAGRAHKVAEAAGGLLGIGSVSEAERDALARIEAALS